MKHLIIALSLLIATPAVAKQPTAAQWKDIHAVRRAYTLCYRTDRSLHSAEYFLKACAANHEGKLQKKLEAQGFCFYGVSGVGRPSQDGKHCYERDY
jgi:hypothetical protein